jgi:hypothetical protein
MWNGNECVRNEGNENLKETIPSRDYNKSETIKECGLVQPFE